MLAVLLHGAHRLDQMRDALLLDEAADEERIGWALRLRREARLTDLDAIADDAKLLHRKAAVDQGRAYEVGDADDRRRLTLEILKPPLIDGRHEAAAVMRALGRIA